MGTENFSIADMAAVCKDGGCNGNNWNNPMWLLWALLFGGGNGFGFNRNNGCAGEAVQNAEIMAQLNSLREQIADNQNANVIGAGIGANHEALHDLAQGMGLSFAGTNANVNDAKTATILSAKDAQAQMSQCCCENRMQTMQMGYEGQLRDQGNTCAIINRINQLANGVTQGFASIGYAQSQQTNELTNVINAGNQRIVDTLNAHWNAELQQKYNDVRLEMSQLKQNEYLVSQLKTTA